MAEPTRTQDGTHSHTWEDWPEDLSAERAKPGLRLLYHVDLARIGALSQSAPSPTPTFRSPLASGRSSDARSPCS
jgi:hypothetical protein